MQQIKRNLLLDAIFCAVLMTQTAPAEDSTDETDELLRQWVAFTTDWAELESNCARRGNIVRLQESAPHSAFLAYHTVELHNDALTFCSTNASLATR
ncbi:MAG: hypothetical protein AAFO81_14035 [Pseudomonadota bacterium]